MFLQANGTVNPNDRPGELVGSSRESWWLRGLCVLRALLARLRAELASQKMLRSICSSLELSIRWVSEDVLGGCPRLHACDAKIDEFSAGSLQRWPMKQHDGRWAELRP